MKSEVDINWRRKNKHVGVAQFQTLNIWKLPNFNSASRLKKWCWEDVIFAVGVFTRITLLPYPGVTSKSEITKLENMFLFFFGFTRGWTISDERLIFASVDTLSVVKGVWLWEDGEGTTACNCGTMESTFVFNQNLQYGCFESCQLLWQRQHIIIVDYKIIFDGMEMIRNNRNLTGFCLNYQNWLQ